MKRIAVEWWWWQLPAAAIFFWVVWELFLTRVSIDTLGEDSTGRVTHMVAHWQDHALPVLTFLGAVLLVAAANWANHTKRTNVANFLLVPAAILVLIMFFYGGMAMLSLVMKPYW